MRLVLVAAMLVPRLPGGLLGALRLTGELERPHVGNAPGRGHAPPGCSGPFIVEAAEAGDAIERHDGGDTHAEPLPGALEPAPPPAHTSPMTEARWALAPGWRAPPRGRGPPAV